MKFTGPRHYQLTQIDKGATAYMSGIRRLLWQLATGGGKTVMFSAICHRRLQALPNTKILICVHRKKLLKQTIKTLYNTYGISAQKIVSGMPNIPHAQVYVGMAETVYRRIKQVEALHIEMLIVDECHEGIFKKLYKHFPEPCIIAGFSATPLSSNKKDPLKNYFDAIVTGVEISELIALNQTQPDEGLVQNITYGPEDIVDKSEFKNKFIGDDYNLGAMSATYSKPRYVNLTVDYYEKYAKGTKAIIFNCDITHAKLVADAFKARGYDCRHFDSEMEPHEQEYILKWYEHTPGAIISSVGILTTGFDEPTIETVIVNRSTISLVLWLQMCGRGSRPCIKIGKNFFTIIDLGGNASLLGDWCDPHNWEDLFYNPPPPGKPKDVPPAKKSCKMCDAMIAAQAKVCKFCGYTYPDKTQEPEGPFKELRVVTQGINVKAIIEKNSKKKKYIAFYAIIEDIAKAAKKTIKRMDAEAFDFLHAQAVEKVQEFAAAHFDKIVKWHHDETHKTLHAEIEKRFPGWQADTNGGKQSTGGVDMAGNASVKAQDRQTYNYKPEAPPDTQGTESGDIERSTTTAYRPDPVHVSNASNGTGQTTAVPWIIAPIQPIGHMDINANRAMIGPVLTPKPEAAGSGPNFLEFSRMFTAP